MVGEPRCQITLLCLGILMMLLASPLSAQQQGEGTVTIDSEARSFDINPCYFFGPMVRGNGTDEDGNLMTFIVGTGQAQSVSITLMYSDSSGRPTSTLMAVAGSGVTSSGEPATGLLVQLEGLTVTASGTFVDNANQEHEVEISIDCILGPLELQWPSPA